MSTAVAATVASAKDVKEARGGELVAKTVSVEWQTNEAEHRLRFQSAKEGPGARDECQRSQPISAGCSRVPSA